LAGRIEHRPDEIVPRRFVAAEPNQEPAEPLQLVQIQPLDRHGLPGARHVQQKRRRGDPTDQQIKDSPHLIARCRDNNAIDISTGRDIIDEGARIRAQPLNAGDN
jgi:hypothetical protein